MCLLYSLHLSVFLSIAHKHTDTHDFFLSFSLYLLCTDSGRKRERGREKGGERKGERKRERERKKESVCDVVTT